MERRLLGQERGSRCLLCWLWKLRVELGLLFVSSQASLLLVLQILRCKMRAKTTVLMSRKPLQGLIHPTVMLAAKATTLDGTDYQCGWREGNPGVHLSRSEGKDDLGRRRGSIMGD